MIRLITKNSDDYDEKYMKIKFNSDDELPLNKAIETPSMIIIVRTVFHENNKYYPQVSLEECLYKLRIIWKCYIFIELMFVKESMLKQVHQKSVIFVTIGISWIKVLSFKQLSAIDTWFINDLYEP